MKKYTFLLLISTLLLFNQLSAQCPGCIIDTTYTVTPAEPSIRPDTLPTGFTNQFYEANIDFYLPAQFQHSSGTNVTLTKVEVLNVAGLPFGMSFESSSPNNTFFPSQNPPTTEHGCAKICGTAIFPGQYNIVVFVRAYASTILGNQTSDDSFIIPFTVLPGGSGNASFTASQTIGCGSLTTLFQTNLPSQGIPGFSYQWHFGNGHSSFIEAPPAVNYSTPGQYIAHCQTTIDTLKFNYLNNITVLGTSCSDMLGKPDLFVIVKNSTGDTLYLSPVVDNENPPVSFNIPDVPLYHNQSYVIEVWDEDLWGALEHCKNFNINGSNPGTTLWSGNDGISYTTFRPVLSFNDSVTINVYPAAIKPVISASPTLSACQNDSILLSSSTATSYQWFNDTTLLFGANQSQLYVHETGKYYVVSTESTGCQASSDTLYISFYNNPPKPTFWRQGDTLKTLLSGYDLQWYFNNNAISGAITQSCPISAAGNYSLKATSAQGCFSLSDIVYYQPFNSSIEDMYIIEDFVLYPNPNDGQFNVSFTTHTPQNMTLNIYNLLGVKVYSEQIIGISGRFNKFLGIFLNPSIYTVTIENEKGMLFKERLIIQ